MKTRGAAVFDGSKVGRFEGWLVRHSSRPQLLTGHDMNQLMKTTAANWGEINQPAGAHYIEHKLFRISREGIIIIKEIT